MIEKFRKYTGLMFVALVMVVLGLIFFIQDTGLLSGRGRGAAVLKIHGRTYSYDDYSMLGDRSLQLAGDLRMTLMLGQLAGNPWQPNPEEFFINRMLLRHAQDTFGIHPSDEQVFAYLQERSVFVNQGEFNQQAYTQYVNRQLGRYGMNETHVHELVRDYLAYEKLFELVGGGLLANSDFTRRSYANQNQKISLRVIEFPLSDYEEKVDPSEEDIKTFWEENKEAYTTELRRKFSFISVTPEVPKADEKEDDEKEDDEKEDDEKEDDEKEDDEKEDDKKEDDKKEPKEGDDAAADKDTEKEETDAEVEARRKAERELAGEVDTFLSEVEDSEGSEFEKLAEKAGWEIKTTEWFTKSSLPSDLNRPLREGVAEGRTLAFYLFDDLTVTTDPISKFTPAIPIADGGWIIARLDEEDPVRPKTFEEAKVEARADRVAQLATESMKKDAEAAHAKLAEAVAAGTQFGKAAKDAGLEPKAFTDVGRSTRPPGLTEPRGIFEAAAHTDPGTIADVLHENRRSVIIFVEKREVVREENLQARIEAFANRSTNQNRYIAFGSWLKAAREQANVQRLQ
jgi:hypothetical protein